MEAMKERDAGMWVEGGGPEAAKEAKLRVVITAEMTERGVSEVK